MIDRNDDDDDDDGDDGRYREILVKEMNLGDGEETFYRMLSGWTTIFLPTHSPLLVHILSRENVSNRLLIENLNALKPLIFLRCTKISLHTSLNGVKMIYVSTLKEIRKPLVPEKVGYLSITFF